MTKLRLYIVVWLFYTLSSGTAWSDNVNTVTYDGTLINLACRVDESAPTLVDMGTIIDKELYLHGKTVAKPFSLALKDCDPTVANTVSIRLKGATGSVTPDGYLALDASSEAKGAVIGVTDTRERVVIGNALPQKPLEMGTMHIPLYAYLQITSEALANDGIVPGPFTATLYYQVEFE
ncbi:fimbrial protein [Providencia sp. Me31A]|uniref:fimbrial protein n=1 Tax=Providencia sp. Me31A TaxID=3392637 RepID=UPI003D2C40A3